MKVAFVHDCAHTCEDLAPHLNDLGVDTCFIPLCGVVKLANKIRDSGADVIHGNYIRSPAYACILSGKRPYVLHGHGDDIRYGLGWKQRLAISMASLVLYSTEDLAGKVKSSVLLPQPVDNEKFNPDLRKGQESCNRALYILQTTSDMRLRFNESQYLEQIRSYCENSGYDLSLIKMGDNKYDDMPKFLSQFSLYFERQFPATSLSKTAIECLSMGMTVLKNFQVVTRDVAKHYSKNVASQLARYYQNIAG